MKKIQTVLKLFPHTYTNHNIQELKGMLADGWIVSQVILSYEDRGSKIYDYILEKELNP